MQIYKTSVLLIYLLRLSMASTKVLYKMISEVYPLYDDLELFYST